jgi:carbamoyl-phosphate synthase large subunit
MNILVTAAGSPLGQSVVKAIKLSNLDFELYLTDNSNKAAGFYIFDDVEAKILPSVNSEEYENELHKYIDEKEIDLIFPLLNVEYKYFSSNYEYFAERNIKIIMPSKEHFKIANDKYESIEQIRASGITVPDTIVLEPGIALEKFLLRNIFPVIIKPRVGASSNDVYLVRNEGELLAYERMKDPRYYVVQEYMEGQEFTVGVFLDKSQTIATAMVIERDLKFGLSYSGKVIINTELADYSISVAKALKLNGSSNVQLKIHKGAPKAFEVNPRLSSTTSIRANFGFNEIELLICDALNLPLNINSEIFVGNFSRYWNEVYF